MSGLAEPVENLQRAMIDLGADFWRDSRAINDSKEAAGGALQEVSQAAELVAGGMEKIRQLLGTLSTTEATSDTLSQQATGHAATTSTLLDSAAEVLDHSENDHATQALAYLRQTKAEADSSVAKCAQIHEESQESIRLAMALNETLGTARSALTDLGEKIETMVATTISAATDARNAALQTNLTREELTAYKRDVD